MALISEFLEILGRPTILAILIGIMELLLPIWIAFILGLLVGWVWKPRCSTSVNFRFSVPSVSYGWVPHPFKGFVSAQSLDSSEVRIPNFDSRSTDEVLKREQFDLPQLSYAESSASELGKEGSSLITDEDLEHLCHLVERRDGGPPWKHVMDRSSHNMSYQAWQRDIPNGPPQYCSRTVYEDATPELLRDFFWDDEFRLKWDDMIVHAEILDESTTTGAMVVHWIRKFPFFCSDREYIISRRIWESEGSYYCITKGVPFLLVPRKDRPRRVDVYYSSWFIQAVKRNGESSASEVLLFHHEDMGIPWEIAKIGVRQGMWGAVKNIGRGFRAYQNYRSSGGSLSHHALMAHINTKIHPTYLTSLEGDASETQLIGSSSSDDEKRSKGIHIPKLLIIGGVVALACSLDQGLLTKTLIFGIARKFGNIGRRAMPRTH